MGPVPPVSRAAPRWYYPRLVGMARRESSAGLGGWRGRARAGGARVPHFLLRLDELAIVRRIKVEQRSAGGEVLNESLADGIGGARRQNRHDKSGCQYAENRHELERAGGADAAGRRDHRTGQTRDQCLAAIFGERHIINLRDAS